jgi:hypothetical protein
MKTDNMNAYQQQKDLLRQQPATWLVTGVAEWYINRFSGK